jgi:hypothetical protein
MIRSAHCTDAAIDLPVSGLPLGVPNAPSKPIKAALSNK